MGKILIAIAATAALAGLAFALGFVRALRKRRERRRMAMAEWQRELNALEKELASKAR